MRFLFGGLSGAGHAVNWRISILLLAFGLGTRCLAGGEAGPEPVDREAVVRAMLDRSRLLDAAHFRVPRILWEDYVREALQPARKPPAPVPFVALQATYAIAIAADRKPLLVAALRVHVFEPETCGNLPVLSAVWAWEGVTVDGAPATLATEKGWLRYSPAAAGEHAIEARVALREVGASGGTLDIQVPATVRTLVSLDSPDAWELAVQGAPLRLVGAAAGGTHGQVAVSPRERLNVSFHPPVALTERPPRFTVKGSVVWNLDDTLQQVAAELNVGIVGGSTDRLELALPAAAERVSVTGPDVRDVQVAAGRASVFLRGKVRERTRLHVAWEMPLAKAGVQRLGELALSDGHWDGGTLVVTNTAGGTEVLAGSLAGLRQIAIGEIPEAARAILAGAPAIACEITSRTWSAEAEVLRLGEFALQESIADLAHYEIAFDDDGTLLCKASYELRNRTRQFLRLDLPRGAMVIQARVNEESKPATPVAGVQDAYLLPLIRSVASVKGLVTFPVEIVFLCRGGALGRRGDAALALPRIDVPIAYAWCEAYVPEGMKVRRWEGPLKQVEKYSNETASASLSYGLGMAAEGYKPQERPAPQTVAMPPPPPTPQRRPEKRRPGSILGGFLSDQAKAKDQLVPLPEAKPPAARPQPLTELPPSPEPVVQPPINVNTPVSGLLQSSLGRNYYRAGRDLYEKQDYANANKSLEQAIALNPKSQEAENARKLLENIKLVKGGETATKLPQSQSEKAAGLQVQKEVAAGQRGSEQLQLGYIERGLQAAREGREGDAKSNLEAAESLGQQLVVQGANKFEQDARLRSAREELGKLREREVAQVKTQLKKVQELKGKGRYTEALQEARQIQPTTTIAGTSVIQHELQDIAVKAAKQKSEELDYRRLGERLVNLKKQVDDQGRRLASHGVAPESKEEEEATVVFDNSLLQTTPLFRGTPPKAGDVQQAIAYLEKRDAEQKDRLSRLAAPKTPPAKKPSEAGDGFVYYRTPKPGGAGGGGKEGAAPGTGRGPGQAPAEGERAAVDLVERLKSESDPEGVERGHRAEGIRSRTPAPESRPVQTPDMPFDGQPESKPSPEQGRAEKPTMRMYDVTDLTVDIKKFQKRQQALAADSGYSSTGGQGGGGMAQEFFGTDEKVAKEEKLTGESVLETIRKTIAPGTWSDGDAEQAGQAPGGPRYTIQYRNGRIVTTHTPEVQQQVEELLTNYRKARGPQVQWGRQIVSQQAKAQANEPADFFGAQSDDSSGQVQRNPQFQSFISRNYAGWAGERTKSGSGKVVAGKREVLLGDLAERLESNLGQKVQVNGINLNVAPEEANGVGVTFSVGNNDVAYALVDEAQLRTLLELDATKKARRIAANPNAQETIVGTEAVLSNDMRANVRFAGEFGNTLDINGNDIDLPHQKYILISNGGYLTAVQANPMQHWTEARNPFPFVVVSQEIEVPRAGRLVKFEKTLVEPTDELALRATYRFSRR